MTDDMDVLIRLSSAVAERTASIRGSVAAIRLSGGRHLSGMLWPPNLVVTSEQSLPKRDEFEVVVAGRTDLIAKVAGRDSGTNIAILRFAETMSIPSSRAGTAQPGALAFAFGADASGEIRVRMGIVNLVGPEWHSQAGGRIDARIVLDTFISRAEEGGPVLDAAGACLGFTTFGPAGQVLVIPTTTVERTLPALLEKGTVSRGWLGVALQPVAVPDALQDQAGQASGLMVMSIVEGGPAAKAGIVAGDIVLTVNGTSTRKFRRLAMYFGSEGIGRVATLRVIRGGMVLSLEATVEARPAA